MERTEKNRERIEKELGQRKERKDREGARTEKREAMIINRIRIRRINETRTEKREVVRLAKKNLESRTRRKKRKKKRER